MGDVPNIAVKPLCGISSNHARDARARAWQYVFECHRRNVSKEDSPVLATLDDTRGETRHDSRATSNRTR